MSRAKIIVVGNGMVGYKFCEEFVKKSGGENYDITVFGEELYPAYDRVHLSEFFETQKDDSLEMVPRNWYSDNQIELISGVLITDIDRDQKIVIDHKGEIYPYDKLVLATGSYPFVPPVQGNEKKGVFVYRTIEDLKQIIAYGKKVKSSTRPHATVMGGGLLGLEAAKAMLDLGLETSVIEFAPWLMPRQIDQRGSDMLQGKLEKLGVEILCNKKTTSIEGADAIESLQFADGSSLDTGMLVISAGIRPRDELAVRAELEIGPRGGAIVNAKMECAPDIYAIGEVASYHGMTYGLVAPGYDMAKVAVSQILHGEGEMDGEIDMSTKLKLIGVDVASFGDPFIAGDQAIPVVYEDLFKGVYKRINISTDGKQLLGGILIGDADDFNMLLQIQKNGMAIPANPVDLIVKTEGGASAVGSVMDFPDDAVICSCESVSKGKICSTIESGEAKDLASVISCTKAGTGCGGCKPMVADLTKATLESLGIEVKDTICQHFDFNRQDLYKIIQVKGYKTFNEVLDHHGNGGHGCEICKPVVASLMATIHADTANEEFPIQDTNDRFLANIQRNGTYSVVPRVPGGEITPDKLIALGQIAKKYDLYTKITGGVRVDLFGATLKQLPLIWKDLIDNGFESGHAYGKALRTVKTCVGSTWCRYGMDESVSFGIKLENRYRGIRAPHKIKGGVSGCIRECAEARGKDFGLIAVEGGWNLYVGGNGGANPRHAELFAEQIDNDTVIKYLDRYLMFYMRTAKPLQRTAAWQESLEGGIDYLREVIIEDKLGIADDLEQEMIQLVNRYKCEWTQAINDPEMMKRFNHFVNSKEEDENVEFVAMRDQKMPKPWK